jgi:hypothetical protein
MNSRISVTIAAVLLALMMSSPAAAQNSSPHCNNKLIRGTYGFTLEGQKLGGNGPIGSQVGVAMTTFDGNENLTQIDSVTVNGVHIADFSHPVANGTYKVNSNCTGTFNIQFADGRPPVTVDFVVVDNGDEIDTVVVAPANCGMLPMAGCIATRSIGKRRFAVRW